jgi:deoxyribonucleoside regulator
MSFMFINTSQRNNPESSLLADDRFLRKVATFYYMEGQTQEAIARELYCSRQTISKALQKAEDRGILQIAVVPEERTGYLYHLARDLRFTLGLEELLLVPGRHLDDEPPHVIDDIVADITATAANYLDQVLTDHDILAVTGGRSIMRNVVRYLNPSKILSNLQVVPTIGFVETYVSTGDANLIAYDIANIYEAKHAWLPIPAIVDTREQQEQARALPLVREVFTLLEQATVIMMGIWTSDIDHGVIKRGILSEQQLAAFRAYHPVADINHWVFDAQGHCINEILEQPPYYLTGLEIPHLRARIKEEKTKVILVAGASKSRIPAIRAALNAGIVNVLITDHITAEILKSEVTRS